MEAGFLLYVLSSAWISWYIFSTLFTVFRPIKSTLYSVFYIFTWYQGTEGWFHRSKQSDRFVYFFACNFYVIDSPSKSNRVHGHVVFFSSDRSSLHQHVLLLVQAKAEQTCSAFSLAPMPQCLISYSGSLLLISMQLKRTTSNWTKITQRTKTRVTQLDMSERTHVPKQPLYV